MNETELVYKIMDDAAPDWGVCDFSGFRDALLPCRAQSRLPQNARRIITAVFPYRLQESMYENTNISRYAAVPDYHTVVPPRLQSACDALQELYPDEQFAPFSDNSPIPEVRAAIACGLGVRGDNGLFIHKEYGSFVFLGEIVTTLNLPVCEGTEGECLHCGKCRRACPVNALESGKPDAALCLSALTQKKGVLTPAEEALIKKSGCAWGCDVCQNVCPLNEKAKINPLAAFAVDVRPVLKSGCDIAGRAYEWRGRNVIDRNLRLLEEQADV